MKNGRYPIINIAFNSPAAKLGMRPYEDYVINLDVEQTDRPAKEWIYLLALFALALVVSNQLARRRLEKKHCKI
tara:strand:- start:874 stop:1095 length:222 start_codon:yes stop_codon:yes gene_type:complete